MKRYGLPAIAFGPEGTPLVMSWSHIPPIMAFSSNPLACFVWAGAFRAGAGPFLQLRILDHDTLIVQHKFPRSCGILNALHFHAIDRNESEAPRIPFLTRHGTTNTVSVPHDHALARHDGEFAFQK